MNWIFRPFVNNYIDSIRVHVDSVIVDGFSVKTKFHYKKEISFQYTLRFKKDMPSNMDSLFIFMKGLQPGTDTMVNFHYTGHRLNDPFDTSQATLTVYAFPGSVQRE